MTEEALAALLQAGDESAWRRICDDFSGPLYRYCYWLAGADAAAAEDLRQEAFLAAIAGIAGYRGEVPPDYRAALLARYFDGESVECVAARLGRSYKAAESVLSRARQAFFERFRKEFKHG